VSGLSSIYPAAYAWDANYAWQFEGQVISDGTEQSRHFDIGRPNILMHLDSIHVMMLKAYKWRAGGCLIVGWSLSEAGTECVRFVFGHILCLENGHECVIQLEYSPGCMWCWLSVKRRSEWRLMGLSYGRFGLGSLYD
jgi:hypothetical protein